MSDEYYNNKYLKYKNKYLRLKGGMPRATPEQIAFAKNIFRDIDPQDPHGDIIFQSILEDLARKYDVKYDSRVDTEKTLNNRIFKSPKFQEELRRTEEGLMKSPEFQEELRRADKGSHKVALLSRAIDAEAAARATFTRRGSVAAAERTPSDTFFVYTTGLGDVALSGNPDERLPLVKLWLSVFCNSITRAIPPNFRRIVIRHFDPLYQIPGYVLPSAVDITRVTRTINDTLGSAKTSLDPRITSHEFIADKLPYTALDYPHIIIDQAHIFGYFPDERHSHSVYLTDGYLSEENLTPLDIKSLYVPYNDEKWAVSRNLLTVTSEGVVKTYIDCLIDGGFILKPSYNPNYTVIGEGTGIGILDELIRRFERHVREKGIPPGRSISDIDDIMRRNKPIIFDEVLEKLHDHQPREYIKDFRSYYSFQIILGEIKTLFGWE